MIWQIIEQKIGTFIEEHFLLLLEICYFFGCIFYDVGQMKIFNRLYGLIYCKATCEIWSL